jgi:hypothetical protein
MLSLLISGSMLLLQACFPFGPEDIEDFDIVGTFYDENVNFGNFKTYAMPDTVVKVSSTGVTNEKEQYDDLILSQVEANMSAAGYERISDPQNADMIMTVAIARAGYSIDQSYDYGDYYGDRYDDYGTGGYYYTGDNYQVDTGTVLMSLANNDGNPSLESSLWLGMLNGIVEQSFTNTSRRLIELINQAFVQSPYLGTSQ